MQKAVLLLFLVVCITFIVADTCPRPTSCATNSCNNEDNCCNNLCVPSKKLGEACDDNDCTKTCGSENRCYKGVCAYMPEGCICTTGADCSSDQQCVQGKCAANGPTPCKVQADCPNDTICYSGGCRIPAAENQTCVNEICQLGLYCQRSMDGSAICTKQIKANETCSSDGSCEAGLYCSFTSGLCSPQLAAGETCSADSNCVSDICMISNQTCAAGPLPAGSQCYMDTQCQSTECGCAAWNGTVTGSNCSRSCQTKEARTNGEYCAGDFQCASGLCGCLAGDPQYCNMAKCTAGDLPDGSFCTRSDVCKGKTCDYQTLQCYTFDSVPDGASCFTIEQCKAGSKCTAGKCQSVTGPCSSDQDCGTLATCKCGANGVGSCQVDPFFGPYLRCIPDIANYMGNCSDNLESPSCKSLIADVACCMGCDGIFAFSRIFGDLPYSFDCASKMATKLDQPPCCRATSQDACNVAILDCGSESSAMQIFPAISMTFLTIFVLLQ